MITRIKSDRIVKDERVFSGYIYINGNIIAECSDRELDFDCEIDLGGKYVCAGFIDIHTHGANGYDYANGKDAVIKAANCQLSHGVTSVCPTLSAAPLSELGASLDGIREAMEDINALPNIIGAHIEGPYLSPEYCGAQSLSNIKAPQKEEYESFAEKHAGTIARWTYAPEVDRDGFFCKYITQKGIVASAGHSGAKYADMVRAIENGCSLVTHLYSCTSSVTRENGFRSGGVIESALLHDEIYTEIIADGCHLPTELIKLIIKAKGYDKVALVTDSLFIAGTDLKYGRMIDTDFVIEDGVCKLADRSAFAGSIAFADDLIKVVTRKVGVPLPRALKMLTEVPAKIMHLNKGVLDNGFDADIIAFDDDISVTDVFVLGKKVI